jgi:multimeric flavodoxin WrbA
MKSVIIYYSYTGNTKKIASILSEYLREKGEVQSIELRDLNENGRFFSQAAKAFKHKRAEIEPVNFDLKSYHVICIGTPVWAFAPTPAINTYLDKCFGIEGKEMILFTTYGSGTGNVRCLNYMQGILGKKDAKNFKRFSIQQFKVGDKEFVLSRIKEAMRLW